MRLKIQKSGVAMAMGLAGVILACFFSLLAPSFSVPQVGGLGKFRTEMEWVSVDAPTCLSNQTSTSAASLVMTCYDGNVYIGAGKVAAGSSAGTALTMTASESSCPLTCNYIYSDSSGTLHVTTTLATAFTSTTAPLYYVQTNSTTITSVQPVWRSSSHPGLAIATGSGQPVMSNSPTITTPVISGHSTIEGVTPTGATGTGNIVFGTSPAIVSPTLTTAVITQPNTAVGATLSPSCATQSGSMIFIGALTGEVVTLPTPVAGCEFDFTITVSNTSNYNEIESGGASIYLLGEAQHCATGIACLDFWANGTSTIALKMDGAHLGGLIGSHFHVWYVSATQWGITGANLGTATMTTAFNTSD